MIELSLPNFVTIGLMSAIFIAVFTAAMGYFGFSTSWMN